MAETGFVDAASGLLFVDNDSFEKAVYESSQPLFGPNPRVKRLCGYTLQRVKQAETRP